MEFVCYLIMGWMFNFITALQEDESISFSPIRSTSTSNSFWYGNLTIGKDRLLIEEGISLQIYLNEYQGLLFYAIDSNYRTIWVEFSGDVLDITHYNFRINELDKRTLKLSDLLGVNKKGKEVSLNFSFKNNELKISSNGKSQTIDYFKSTDSIKKENLYQFIENFFLPIPFFKNTNESTEVHIWIGNTAQVKNEGKFQNIATLKDNPNNLWGCIMFFSIKNIKLKLATTGDHIGTMIKPFCKPICNSSSCYNNGHCYEQWRGKYDCDCEPSQFIGKRCELEHSIQFNGSFSLQEKIYFNLKKLKFSFKPILLNEYGGLKLLSLKFSKNESFQVYIDVNDYFHGKFIQSHLVNTNVHFKVKMMHNKMYTFYSIVDYDGMKMKIFDSHNKVLIDKQVIPLPHTNLITEHILVGDLHNQIYWYKNFKGCFINLVLKSKSKQFIWNKMANFMKFPKCEKSFKDTKRLNSSYKSESLLKEKNIRGEKSRSNENKHRKSDNYMAYVIIAVVTSILLMFIFLFIILAKLYSRKSNQNRSIQMIERRGLANNYQTLEGQFTKQKQDKMLQDMDVSDSAPYHIYPSPIYMTFKPAYKAKSMCSSTTNRSLISLPIEMTPTLATPEDGERL